VSDQTIVIVGAGHAGGRAAEAMRQTGYTGRIILVGEEAHPPYERPPLSKDVLATDYPVERTYLNPADFYEAHNIELKLRTRAEAIDAKDHKVMLSGEHAGTVSYDRLLLVTGGRVRRLPTPGADLAGIHYIRSIDDSLGIKPLLKPDVRVVVIGGGFIGLEAAASARKLGCDVTVLEMMPTLLTRVCDGQVGDWFVDFHRAHGVRVLTGVTVDHLEGQSKVERIVLGDGNVLPADLVIVGIGIIPNTEIAGAAGLTVGNGIVVDEFGQTTDTDIFAAGDVANLPNPILGTRMRLESWANAQNGGIAVARNMVIDGPMAPYSEVPWFWSDQYDLNLQIAGAPTKWEKLVTRGDPASGKFIHFYMDEGRVVAANTFNFGRDMRFAKRLIETGKQVSESDLADEKANLKTIAS
jgi:3-phenylpropionate/trans-cinnamate dioxygenase ferredoxin reductase subunit